MSKQDVNDNFAISVIIPTYRRRKYLLKVLDDLAAQERQPFEVIVSDSSPEEEALTETDLARYPAWLKYQRIQQGGNISRQRNEALRLCQCDIILFLDDDVEFSSDLLTNYQQAFAETKADGISGIVLNPGQKPIPRPVQLRPDALINPGAPNYHLYTGVTPTYVICTASFAVRRAAVFAVGGFDEQIRGSCDDVELGVRLVKAGFKIIHHDRPWLHHLRAGSSGSRSPEFGQSWHYANWFYFQLKHIWKRPGSLLLLLVLVQYCRPSRHWLQPQYIIQRAQALITGYQHSLKRIAEGPLTNLSADDRRA